MFTWERWVSGETKVFIRTLEEMIAFLAMMEADGYGYCSRDSAHTFIEIMQEVEEEGQLEGIHIFFNPRHNGMFAYINDDIKDVVYFDKIYKEMPTPTDLMSFLEE